MATARVGGGGWQRRSDTMAKGGLQSLNFYLAASAGMIRRATISSDSGPA
jgi:hypothetical protein